jgi:hypothetical protein
LYQSWFGFKVMFVSVFGDNHLVDEITFDALFEREDDYLLSDIVAVYGCRAIFICSGRYCGNS